MGVYKRGETYYISYCHNGKRIREAMGKNKATAEAVLARKKLDLRAGKYSDPAERPQIPFSQACDDYMKAEAHLKGQETLKYVCKTLKGYFTPRGYYGAGRGPLHHVSSGHPNQAQEEESGVSHQPGSERPPGYAEQGSQVGMD